MGDTAASEGYHERCRNAQCREFNHRCPGCGNDLHGDNLCMVSACEQEV